MIPLIGKSQNDTINQVDENDLRQGHWIFYGKDRPESGYPADSRIEEGRYIDNRKEGTWIKYYTDGKTVKIKGAYKNNRPNGEFESYYENGTIRRKGCFSRGSTLHDDCEEYWYYESGKIKQKRTIDSTVNYFESGCLMSVTKAMPSEYWNSIIIQYTADSCNVIKDTIIEYTSPCKGIIIERSDCTFRNNTVENTQDNELYKFPPAVTKPTSLSALFKPNDYNKVYNEFDELWQEGEFKDGRLLNGKVYLYDSDGILIKVLVYKNGFYHSDGQL